MALPDQPLPQPNPCRLDRLFRRAKRLVTNGPGHFLSTSFERLDRRANDAKLRIRAVTAGALAVGGPHWLVFTIYPSPAAPALAPRWFRSRYRPLSEKAYVMRRGETIRLLSPTLRRRLCAALALPMR